MKIYSGRKENLEILKVMHKSFTQKFGDICKLGEMITLKNKEDFNNLKSTLDLRVKKNTALVCTEQKISI